MKLDSIEQFITYNRRIQSNGQHTTISVVIPEMSDEDLVKEVKRICDVLVKASNVLTRKETKVNVLLAATTGRRKEVTPQDASNAFEKGFGVLVKLSLEVTLRGLNALVMEDIQQALSRKKKVDVSLDNDDLLLLGA